MFRIKRLNVKFAKYQNQSPGDALLKRCPVKSIRDAVFHLIKFQAKDPQLYWKETPAYVLTKEFHSFKSTYFVERRQTAPSEMSSKSQ